MLRLIAKTHTILNYLHTRTHAHARTHTHAHTCTDAQNITVALPTLVY